MYDTPNSGLCASKKSQSRPSYLTFEDKALSEGLKSRFWWAIYFAKLSPNVFSIALTTAVLILDPRTLGPFVWVTWTRTVPLNRWSFFNKVNELLSTCTGRRLSLNQFWFLVVRTTRATPLPEPKPIESKASAGLFQVSCADHLSDYFQIPTLLFWQHFSRSISISLSVLYSYCSKKHKTNCKE